MYTWQIATIKKFVTKFNVTNYAIQQFLRAHRIQSPEMISKKCTSGQHEIKFGDTVYIYDSKEQSLQSVFCNDLGCFLNVLHKSVIEKFTITTRTKNRQHSKEKKSK